MNPIVFTSSQKIRKSEFYTVNACLNLSIFFFLFIPVSYGQNVFYEKAFDELKSMLDGSRETSFKEAVFCTENAYFGDELNKNGYEQNITNLHALVDQLSRSSLLVYDQKDKPTVSKHAALYQLMTDTISFIIQEDTVFHFPFLYDFDDVFGDSNWSNMFVTKLLATKKGNCHSLPYLYKILADELGIKAHLALAPNHIYIKSWLEKTGWYNTELTSGSFPIDAWLVASGYVHMDAIRNGVYMKALTDTQAIAMCVIDLAMNYDRTFPENDGTFILKCIDLSLQYFPKYITAILLKAETLQRLVKQQMKNHGVTDHSALFELAPKTKTIWNEMQTAYAFAHQLGYRQMPKQMYLDWLASLKEEERRWKQKADNFSR